jgi:IS30 family transposase
MIGRLHSWTNTIAFSITTMRWVRTFFGIFNFRARSLLKLLITTAPFEPSTANICKRLWSTLGWTTLGAIYRSLFVQARGVLKKELMQHLRSQRRIRRSRHSRDRGHHRGQVVDAMSIRERLRRSRTAPFPGIGRAIC